MFSKTNAARFFVESCSPPAVSLSPKVGGGLGDVTVHNFSGEGGSEQ